MKTILIPLATTMTLTVLSTISATAANFGDDVAFMKKYIEIIELTDSGGQAKVALSAAYQGRVMTSTAGGDAGASYGWINRELIASGKLLPHINVFGGEDRFWLGPEGGQFSIFFAKGAKFELSDWQTPAPIDSLPFKVAHAEKTQAVFEGRFTLTNYSGTRFDVAVKREVRLLDKSGAWKKLGVREAEGVKLVGFETDNKITNVGENPWKKETGLLSIWILGMYNPSPSATVVVPIQPGPESALGTKVTSDYFGSVPPERLVVKDTVVFFCADGKLRSKIGISPKRSKAVLGSYDAASKTLTIVQFTQREGVTDYVNSLWKLQDNPYGGDAANSYNDGPASPGAKPLGPFYELESSSPAAALAPAQNLTHVHRTIHLSGPESALDPIARKILGVSLAEIESALPRK